jgi:putative acetyltransferase
MHIRTETTTDALAISTLVTAAFLDAKHTSGTEAAVVDGLRDAGMLTLSLVAVEKDVIVGHVAFSPVTIGGRTGWYVLGPVAVRRDRRRRGIAARLISEGLTTLKVQGAGGCVVLGNPAYYGRFGFTSDPYVTFGGVPPEDFQRLRFQGEQPTGSVAYHSAFDAA